MSNKPATHTTVDKPALPLSHISKLFRVFKVDYGTAFTSRFTTAEEINEAKIRWSQRLSHLTGEQIRFGVENMGKAHKTFPPNLNEFIQICLSCKTDDQLFDFVRLPSALTVSKETVHDGIKEIKKKCGLK